jgi:hypothetical protein
MKKVFVLMFCLFIVASVCYAQERMVSDNRQIVGGYTKVSVDSKDVTDALSYVKKNFPAFGVESVEEAYTQVVAGLNVKMVCKVAHPKCSEKWELTVYRDLKSEYHLTGAKSVQK